jgi:hypothetical protein
VPTAGMYRLRGVYEPWGDYGNILVSGLLDRDETSGLLLIERTGPFVPPISIGGLHSPLVVTDSFRRELERSGLTGFGFQPAVKQRIVRLAWERWDRSAAEPAEYPAEGEPETTCSAASMILNWPRPSGRCGSYWRNWRTLPRGNQTSCGTRSTSAPSM